MPQSLVMLHDGAEAPARRPATRPVPLDGLTAKLASGKLVFVGRCSTMRESRSRYWTALGSPNWARSVRMI